MIDAIWRSVLIVGYRVLHVWWFVRRPRLQGAYVVVRRCAGDRGEPEILLIRNSYRSGWTVPCGALKRGESPRAAGRRELHEEVGLAVDEERLVPAGAIELTLRWRRDLAHFFELTLLGGEEAQIRPDRREVVRTEFVAESSLGGFDLVPHLRRHLSQGQSDS